MTESIGLALQKWFLRNNINNVDHESFVGATDLAFQNFHEHLVSSGAQPRRERTLADAICAVEPGSKEERRLAAELMRRLVHELPN